MRVDTDLKIPASIANNLASSIHDCQSLLEGIVGLLQSAANKAYDEKLK